MSNGQLTLAPKNLSPGDLFRVASVGLRTRRLRAALSSLGIAIGVAAIVAVLGLSSSSAAAVNAEIAALGTNLLKVTNGQSVFGQTAELPYAAPARIARIGPVIETQYVGTTSASAFRSPLIPSINTNAIGVVASTLHLPKAIGTTLYAGTYLNAATDHLPVCVLGAAERDRSAALPRGDEGTHPDPIPLRGNPPQHHGRGGRRRGRCPGHGDLRVDQGMDGRHPARGLGRGVRRRAGHRRGGRSAACVTGGAALADRRFAHGLSRRSAGWGDLAEPAGLTVV